MEGVKAEKGWKVVEVQNERNWLNELGDGAIAD
jgi:hypothetical protein